MLTNETLQTIWLKPDDPATVQIIDQRQLPHRYVIHDIKSAQDGIFAIREMLVRGAPLIGATAAWSLYLAARASTAGQRHASVRQTAETVRAARPTAVNLNWAVDRVLHAIAEVEDAGLVERLRDEAQAICDEDIEICRQIGEHGVRILEEIAAEKGGAPVNVLTHCNAGGLATIRWGTATAPIYLAQKRGVPVHVWVDETRPRNQGSQLTAWELAANGVQHTLIVDNAGGPSDAAR